MHYEAHCVSREQGILQGETQALLRILAKRFGDLPQAVRADIESACIQQLRACFDLALDARSLDDLFAAQRPRELDRAGRSQFHASPPSPQHTDKLPR